MLKIISDGIKHRVVNKDGTDITNVTSVKISEILPGSPIVATITLFNMPVELDVDAIFQTEAPSNKPVERWEE